MFLSNDVFSFQKPFPLLFDVVWSPSSIVEWSVRYPGVILDSLILTNPTEIRKKSILENTRLGLLPLHVNNNFSGFWCLQISTNSVSSIHALTISLDLLWVSVFLPHSSFSIFSTRLKSPPIILLSFGIHSISFIKCWKKCGSSWFGAYRFASVIRTSYTSMSNIINLPSWSWSSEKFGPEEKKRGRQMPGLPQTPVVEAWQRMARGWAVLSKLLGRVQETLPRTGGVCWATAGPPASSRTGWALHSSNDLSSPIKASVSGPGTAVRIFSKPSMPCWWREP